MPSKDKYTDPKLREQVKEEVKESNKGGAPGQWSARKAQIMASEYKKREGGSENSKGDDSGDNKDTTSDEQNADTESDTDDQDVSADDDDQEKESEKSGRKRTRNASKTESTPRKRQKDTGGTSKKTKRHSEATLGSKHDSAEAPAPQGSNERLPKKGQKVTWKAMPGWVHGKVLEIVTSNKTMEGKSIKASKDAPRIALQAESGKFCVHRPEACYFET